MTVAELIAKLSEFRSDCEVIIWDIDTYEKSLIESIEYDEPEIDVDGERYGDKVDIFVQYQEE